jgi:hypothetical protein
MSVGSVYFVSSYIMAVGDVQCCDLDGMSDLRTSACFFGLCLVSCSCVSLPNAFV